MEETDGISHTCCFLGHREIRETDRLRTQLKNAVEGMIITQGVDRFLFGSKSRFNSLCYEVVTELKKTYPKIQRIYVRAEFPVIGEDYKKYLLCNFEETYYPTSVRGAGRASYVKRNMEMIDKSQFCVFYYDAAYNPKGRKSGMVNFYNYARRHDKTLIIFPLRCDRRICP